MKKYVGLLLGILLATACGPGAREVTLGRERQAGADRESCIRERGRAYTVWTSSPIGAADAFTLCLSDDGKVLWVRGDGVHDRWDR